MPDTLRARAHGKINLGLRILGRRPDGFHDLRTIYQTLALSDEVEVEVGAGAGVTLELIAPRRSAALPASLLAVPEDATNLAVRAGEMAREAFGLRGHIHIRLRKHIPMRAGLGGGSSDAATVLALLARRAGARAQPVDLLELAARLGSDVPAFLLGGTVLGVGRGEEVYALPPLPRWWCVLAMPAESEGIDTAGAFGLWDARCGDGRGALTGSAGSGRISTFCSLVFQAQPAFRSQRNRGAGGRTRSSSLALKVQAGLENDFEAVVFPLSPDFPRIQRQLRRFGPLGVSLSGSGACQFGLFAERGRAMVAAAAVRRQGWATVTRLVGREASPVGR